MTGETILLARAKKGDMTAFEAIVTNYENRIYTMALRTTGSEADAADITQEVFLRLWRGLDTFRGDSSLSTWLYRVTSNLCIDLARKHAAERGNVPLEDDEGNVIDLPDHNEKNRPEDALQNSELARELQAALGQLSEEHRQIVTLRDMVGMSYGDIAAALSIEEGTVKSRLARGRAALRKIILERGNISLSHPSNKTERGQEHD